MNMLPLAGYRHGSDPLLLSAEGETPAAVFFARAAALATALPEARHVINICESRASFMLGYAAALLRRQISLLPAGQGRADWSPLLSQYAGAYLLSDRDNDEFDAAGLPHVDIRHWLALNVGEPRAFSMPQIDEVQIAAILFTSGSTGQPTAHQKSFGQLWRGAAALSAALQWPAAPSCAVVGSVPPQHMFGLESTVMLPWHAGVPVHASRPLLAADLSMVLAQHGRPCWWMTTAVHMRAPLSTPAPLPGLQGVLASTMSVPTAQAAAAEAAWQVPVMEIYGSTETGALAIRRTAFENDWQPLPGVRVWNAADDANEKSAGSWAAATHVQPPVQLGDILLLQDNGRFVLGGRANDLVKVGGKRASLAALNQALAAVPGVEEGVYFFHHEAEPAAANDEGASALRPVGFYVSATLSPSQLAAALRERIDPVFIPRPLYRVPNLPRNANGKLPQAALLELLAQCRARPVEKAAAAAPGRAGSPQKIADDHPALPGHFPGDPIVPGVIILARVADAIRARFPHLQPGMLLNVRFHAPLRPGQHFTVQAQHDAGRVRFEMRADALNTGDGGVQLIASGLWACGASASTAIGTP